MNFKKLLISGAAGALMFGSLAVGAFADTVSVNFEPDAYSVGNISGQDGWLSTGPYDQGVVSSPVLSGTQSFRISNAVTSGSFGDQTFSKPLLNEAGETSAQNGGLSSGPRQPYFEASWDFASTNPNSEQPGLAITASPDRGDGARMSWVQMADTPNGLQVNFYDYAVGNSVDTGPCNCAPFRYTTVISGLDRTKTHNIKITMQFVDGAENDVVKIYIDGVLRHTGTSWEDYFRNEEGNPTRTVDSILFRASGTAAPGSLGNGFLIDNFSESSGPVPPVLVGPPTNMNQCKKDDWKLFNNPTFKNQGACVSYVQSNNHTGNKPN